MVLFKGTAIRIIPIDRRSDHFLNYNNVIILKEICQKLIISFFEMSEELDIEGTNVKSVLRENNIQ